MSVLAHSASSPFMCGIQRGREGRPTALHVLCSLRTRYRHRQEGKTQPDARDFARQYRIVRASLLWAKCWHLRRRHFSILADGVTQLA